MSFLLIFRDTCHAKQEVFYLWMFMGSRLVNQNVFVLVFHGNMFEETGCSTLEKSAIALPPFVQDSDWILSVC